MKAVLILHKIHNSNRSFFVIIHIFCHLLHLASLLILGGSSMKVYIKMDLYTINVKFNFPLDFGYTCDVIGQWLPHLSRFIPDSMCFHYKCSLYFFFNNKKLNLLYVYLLASCQLKPSSCSYTNHTRHKCLESNFAIRGNPVVWFLPVFKEF